LLHDLILLYYIRLSALSSLQTSRHQLDLHSFPTRRSSDLGWLISATGTDTVMSQRFSSAPSTTSTGWTPTKNRATSSAGRRSGSDRKSTRLNSSHVSISYAVFCLKKKKKKVNMKVKIGDRL